MQVEEHKPKKIIGKSASLRSCVPGCLMPESKASGCGYHPNFDR